MAKNNEILTASQAVGTMQIAPKICHCHPLTMYSTHGAPDFIQIGSLLAVL